MKANITDALAGMTQLRDQLKKTLSAELPNIQSQIKPVKQILDQYGNAFTTGSQKAQTALKQTGDKAKQTAQVTQQAVNTVKKTLSAMSDPLKNVNMQIDVQKQKLAQLKEQYASVASNKGINSTQALNLQNQMLRVGETISRLQEKANSMGEAEKATTQKVQQTVEAEKNALQSVEEEHRRINELVEKQYAAEQKAKAAEAETAKAALPTSAKRIPSALASNIEARQAATPEPVSESPVPQLSSWQRFTAQYYAILDNVKAKLSQMGLYGREGMKGVETATIKATNATKKWGNQAESSSNKASSGFSRAKGMIGRMLIMMAVWKAVQAVIDAAKTGINDMAQGVSSANVTMSQLATSVLYLKNSIGAALMPAINAIAPAITWITDKIAGLFNMLGALNARIFGGATTVVVAKKANVDYAATLGKTSNAAEKAAEKEKKAAEKAQKVAEKAKEAQEKANESVLSFDKLNKLDAPAKPETSDDTSSGTTPTSDAGAGMPNYEDMFTTQKIPAEISALGDKIRAELAKWAQYAQPAIDVFKLFAVSLEPLKTFAATGLEDFYNDLLVPLGKWYLGEGLPGLLQILTKFNLDVNWSAINKGFDGIWKAIVPFAEHIGEGLLWFLDNALEPAGEWAMNTILPKILDILATAIQIIDGAVEAAKPAFMWLWNNFLEPLGEWTGGIVADALQLISDGLKNINALIHGDFKSADEYGRKVDQDLIKIFGDLAGMGGSSIQIKKLGDNVSESTKRAIGAFDALNTSADKDLKYLEWSGDTVTKSMADKIGKNVQGMADQTIAGFKRQRDDSIKNIKDLANISGGLSKQEADEIIKNINKGYDSRIKTEQEGQQKIQKILDTASSQHRNLTKTESSEINKIKGQMYDSGVKALSKNEVEEQAIYDNMRVNHTATSAQEAAAIVKDSKETTDKTIADANQKYKERVASIVRERDETHAISSDQADKLIKNAAKERDETVKSAQDKHQKVVAEAKKQSGECVNQVDWESGQVKSKWQVFWSWYLKTVQKNWKDFFGLLQGAGDKVKDSWNSFWGWFGRTVQKNWSDFGKQIQDGWNQHVAPWFTWKKWHDLGQQAVNAITAPFRNINWPHISTPHIEWTSGGWQSSGWIQQALSALHLPTQLPKLNVNWYAKGGVFDERSIIGVGEYSGASSNPEIVTPQKIMRDTVVEANGEAVSAIAGLIYQLIDAVRESGSGDIYMDTEKVGKKVISFANGETRRTGKSPILT